MNNIVHPKAWNVNSWRKRIELRSAINRDLEEIPRLKNLVPEGWMRRIALRLVMSSIDGYLFYIKKWLLESWSEDVFSEDEQEVLREARLKRSNDGEPNWKPWNVPIRQNIAVTLGCVQRLFLDDLELFYPGGKLPDPVEETIRLRDRITHPKSSNDFDISDPEFESLTAAIFWYAEVVKLIADCETKYFESLRARWSEIERSQPR